MGQPQQRFGKKWVRVGASVPVALQAFAFRISPWESINAAIYSASRSWALTLSPHSCVKAKDRSLMEDTDRRHGRTKPLSLSGLLCTCSLLTALRTQTGEAPVLPAGGRERRGKVLPRRDS